MLSLIDTSTICHGSWVACRIAFSVGGRSGCHSYGWKGLAIVVQFVCAFLRTVVASVCRHMVVCAAASIVIHSSLAFAYDFAGFAAERVSIFMFAL